MSTEHYQLLDLHLVDHVPVLTVTHAAIRQPKVAEELGTEVRFAVQKHQPLAFLLNLSKVSYMSSTGFAVLLSLSKWANESKITMALCGLHEDVARGSSILGVQRYVGIYASEREALAALKHDQTPG